MRKRHALQTAASIAAYTKRPVGGFRVERIQAGGSLRDFHKWANGQPLIAADRVDRDDGRVLFLLLIEWRERGKYYLVLYPEDQSNPHAELWRIDESEGNAALSWKYTPTKRDGRNAERVACFRRQVGALEVRVALPISGADTPRFLEDLFVLVDNRVRADRLDPFDAEFPEGAAVERLHKSRERSPGVVALAKRIARTRDGHLSCIVCGFDFHAVYGETGDGYIEAHHIRPLSELTPNTPTRAEDLALVCSNCHRMLHRRRPWLGLEELGNLLLVNATRTGVPGKFPSPKASRSRSPGRRR